MGTGRAPQRRRQHAGAARSVQPQSARRSPRSTPISDRTNACLRAIARSRRRAAFATLDRGAAQARRQYAARFPAVRRGTAARQEGAPQGRRRGTRLAVLALRGQRARRDQRVGTPHRRRGDARRRTRRTCWPQRARTPPPTASPAGSCRCACRAICRSCSTPRIAICARRCIARSRPGRANSANPNGTTARSSSACSNCGAKPPNCSVMRSYAEVSLVPKMAHTPAEVLAFLRDLAAKAKPFAEAGHGRTQAVRARRTRAARTSRHGTCRMLRKNCARPATASPTRK